MRLTARYRFRAGAAAANRDPARIAELYSDGVRELASFNYYLAMAASRKAEAVARAAAAGGGPAPPVAPASSADEVERKLFAQLDEEAHCAADRMLGAQLSRRVAAHEATATEQPLAHTAGAGTASATATACAACGTPWPSQKAKFCGECGAKRPT